MSFSDPQIANAGNPNTAQGARPEPLLPAAASLYPEQGESPVARGGPMTPDTGALLKALRRRWLLAITLGLIVGGVMAGATWLFMPKAKDTARTVFHVRAVTPALLYPNQEQHPDSTSYQRTQAALVKSRMVLTAALREVGDLSVLHGEEADPVETLEKLLIVDFTLGPEIMRISISGDDEVELKKIIEAVTEAYDKEILMKEQAERESRLEKSKTVREDTMRNLKRKQDEYGNQVLFADSADPFSQSLRRMLKSVELKDAHAQLTKVQQELIVLESNLAVEQAKLKSNLAVEQAKESIAGARALTLMASPMGQGPLLAAYALMPAAKPRVSAGVEMAMKNDSTLHDLGKERDSIDKSIRDTLAVVKDAEGNSKVAKLREKLKEIDDLIAKRKKELRPILEDQATALRGNVDQSDIDHLKERITRGKEIEATLSRDVEKLTKDTEDLGPGGKKSLDLDRYRIEVAAAEETYKRANAAVESLQVELKAPSQVKTLEKGILTHGNDLKRRSIASAAAGLGGLGFLLLGVAFLEFRSRKIQSTDDVIVGTGLRVVGTLPALPTRRGRPAGAEADAYWRNLMSESVDAIRTLLLYTARKEDLRVVMVTSAVSGEGKTSLSSHLAASLARAGRKTLLVDCDLRKPAAHLMFDLEPKPGFSELLRGETTLAEAVRPTQADTLSVITAGACDQAAFQALAQGAAGGIFQQLRGQYDFVVVDTAPVLPVADSLLIGEHADAVVFSILRDISRMPRVYAAYQRLAMLGIRMLGAVVNGTAEDTYGANNYTYAEN